MPAVTARQGAARARSGLRGVVRTVALTTMAVWAVSALALLIYTWGARSPLDHTLLIPPGTGDDIASGANPLQIPATWTFQADDRLVLVNDDRVDHWLGEFYVPAGETREYELQPAFGGSFLCSLHPDGDITVDVDVRDFDWRMTVFPTLALGPALGLGAAGTARIVRLVAEDDHPSTENRKEQEC